MEAEQGVQHGVYRDRREEIGDAALAGEGADEGAVSRSDREGTCVNDFAAAYRP